MNWYALSIGVGASLGILQVANNAPPGKIQRYVNAALLCLLAAGAAARLAYVGLHWTYYLDNRLETLQIWQGGLSAPGALVGGLLAAFCLAKGMQVSFFKLADILAPMLAPLCISAWLGCWAAGCAYGLPSAAGSWWGISAVDESGTVIPRFPLQFITAFCLAVYLGRIELNFRSFRIPGQKASLIGLGVNLSYLAATFWMGDPAPRWISLRPESWLAIFLSLLNITACVIVFRLIPARTRGA